MDRETAWGFYTAHRKAFPEEANFEGCRWYSHGPVWCRTNGRYAMTVFPDGVVEVRDLVFGSEWIYGERE